MLYFSEGGWTLSEMSQVNEAFVRDYDEDEYERKIAGLVRRIYARDGSAEEIEAWNDATVRLSAADHYRLVLIDEHRGGRRGRYPPGCLPQSPEGKGRGAIG